MKTSIKQIFASIAVIIFTITSLVLLTPFIIFFLIFALVLSFVIRRQIIKNNPDFFKNRGFRKGRIIDQEEASTEYKNIDK